MFLEKCPRIFCYINHKIIISALLAAHDGRVQVLLPMKYNAKNIDCITLLNIKSATIFYHASEKG